MIKADDAGAPQEGVYAPQPTAPVIFDTFAGLNTAATRPGIGDQECSWLDGFMPLGKNNLRTMWGVGTAIYTVPQGLGLQITCFAFANLGTAPVCYVFLNDGAIEQVNLNSGFSFEIAPPGTIHTPSPNNVGVCQWGNQYIIFTANQQNGYFAWDGNALYGPGTVAPLVNVVNSGLNYTTQPSFTVETTGSGAGATFQVILNNDVVEAVNVTNPGSGFGINDFINIVMSGGGSDNTARATATLGPGGVSEVAVLNSGAGYAFGTSAIIVGGGGTGAQILVNGPVPDGGANNHIQSITVITPGTGYTSTPTVQLQNVDAGHGAIFAVAVVQGAITAINLVESGSGYTTPPTVSIIGDGTGGKFLAQINAAGQVTGVAVIDGGQGYTKALVHFSGGNNAAEALVDLMPFGIQGTYAEIFESRVWVANGNQISFTTADSVADFSTSNGGGTIKATDSFLRNQYTALKQTNGFLYILADSSENYISGVTTTGTPPATTFNNQNADPEIGTSWPNSVQVFSRNIVFANSFGVHVSYGGAVTKISEALDGVYNSAFNFGGRTPSAAKAIVFGKRLYMVLVPVIDQITGQFVNKLFLWNGKVWFSSQQDVPLTFIASLELNSNLIAYGTDSQSIYPLFQKPSTGFQKTVQSKLWDKPGGYMFTKTCSRLWGEVFFYNLASSQINVSIDNENGSQIYNQVPTNVGAVLIINIFVATVTLINTFGAAVTVLSSGTGIVVFQPNAVGQQGHLMGLTLSTNCADMALISMAVDFGVFGYDG